MPPAKVNEHIHRLSQVKFQTCSICNGFFVTLLSRNSKGELVLNELELDLTSKPSRGTEHQKPKVESEPAQEIRSKSPEEREQTCW